MATLTKSTLFKRDKKGKVLYWTINTIEKKIDMFLSHGVINIYQGQLGGTEKKYSETIDTGKNLGKSNATTPFQQATSEMISRWNKKKDEGYKDVEDIGLAINPQEYILNVSKLQQMLEDKLPASNTDARGNIKPMLAHPYPDNVEKVMFPAYVQPKIDGVRCIATVKFGPQTEIMLLSRQGKEFLLPHIGYQVIQLARSLQKLTPEQKVFVFDGELYNPNLTFEQVVAGTKGNDYFVYKIGYYIYDVINNDPMYKRVATLGHISNILDMDDAAANPATKDLWYVETKTVTDHDAIDDALSGYLKERYEGAMVRTYDGLYQNTRSYNLLKYKQFDNTEFKIMGFRLGIRGVEDLIVDCYTEGGDPFGAKMSGDLAAKQVLYDNRANYYGKPLTVKHFGWTANNIPRFPIGIAIRDYE